MGQTRPREPAAAAQAQVVTDGSFSMSGDAGDYITQGLSYRAGRLRQRPRLQHAGLTGQDELGGVQSLSTPRVGVQPLAS